MSDQTPPKLKRPFLFRYIILAIPAILFAAFHLNRLFPDTSCNVRWLNQDLEQVTGSFKECPRRFEKLRELGGRQYVELEGRVFRMDNEVVRSGDDACMTGVACIPIITRAQEWRTIEFIELPGSIKFSKLEAYHDGNYLSDGDVQFFNWRQIERLSPPVAMQRLRNIGNSYVTDGRWVLYQEHVAHGADPATFQSIKYLDARGYGEDRSQDFARDKRHVFYQAKPIANADPASFKVIVYADKPRPEGFTSQSSIIAFDKSNVWSEEG